ncbi:MAG: insulinase family protein [Flavobacteriaceae bacterium]|nr:insulinase family protein [Flavobacteriaceae bacterium]
MQAQDRTQPKPGPSPVINIKKPQSFKLPNGLQVLIVENHKLPKVSFSLNIDNSPYAEGTKKGVANLTSSLIGNGSKKISKDAFNEEIDFLGAELSFYASGASGSSLSKYSGRILELMAEGALNPNFTQEEFDKEKDKLLENLKTQEKSVAAVAGRVQNVLAFGKDHPSGEYLSEETIKNVTLADVENNYNTYFVPENAYLVIIGDVQFKETKKAVEKLFGSWVKASAPSVKYSDPVNVQYSQINFVDMPNAVQSEIALQNTVNLKMTDKDYFAAIVANQILGGDFNSYLNMNLREAHGWTYGARSGISGSKYVSTFRASTQVRNAVTDSAVVEFFKEIKKIRTEKVSDEMLANVKAGYVGKFVMQIEKPQTVAGYALRIKTQGLPEDFYENYIKNINAVTAEEVMAAANKYFLEDKIRVVIVGKGSDVIPGLEKLKIPMFYFDKFGAPTSKPVMKKATPAGVTVKTVLDNYIKAVGGEKAVKGVKTISTVASGEIQGTPLEMNTKVTSANKLSNEMKAMGMSIMKQVVNDKGAYVTQQGKRKDLDGEKLAEAKQNAMPFPELTMAAKTSITLDGIESFNGADAYVIKDGKTTHYFDVNTGLKIGQAVTQEANGQKMTQITNYSDYKEVKGIKVPYKVSMSFGPQEIEFKTTDVKINEGVSDADFQ